MKVVRESLTGLLEQIHAHIPIIPAIPYVLNLVYQAVKIIALPCFMWLIFASHDPTLGSGPHR